VSPNVSAHLTLHRYFLAASCNKSLFQTELSNGRADQPHALIHLLLWYGTIYVVLEGWRVEKLTDSTVAKYTSDTVKCELLRQGRNAIFHYNSDYIDKRILSIMQDPDFVEWAHGLHDAIGAFFLPP
jgi:hypothetical protein